MSLARFHSPTVTCMSNSERLSESEQDAILMRLVGVAWVKVLELVRGCYREDMVQDLVVEWLACLRAGTWSNPPEGLDKYVEKAVRNRRIEDFRRRRRTMRRDAVHLEVIAGAPREWMSQDLKLEADRLDAFADAVRATLPRKYVRAHRMVREDGITYAEVAKTLRTSVASIHKFVAVVQRTFREAARGTGVEPMRSVRGGRPPRPRARQIKRLYRKGGVGARRVAGVDRTARVVVDPRPEAAADRKVSPVESNVSPVPANARLGDRNERAAIAGAAPAEANDPTVPTGASSARPSVEPVATQAELERREPTLGATNVQLVARTVAPVTSIASHEPHNVTPAGSIGSPVARDEATERANVQPVAHDETSEATFERTAQIKRAAVCAKAEAAPMLGSSADPTRRPAPVAAAFADPREETAGMSA